MKAGLREKIQECNQSHRWKNANATRKKKDQNSASFPTSSWEFIPKKGGGRVASGFYLSSQDNKEGGRQRNTGGYKVCQHLLCLQPLTMLVD